MSYVIRIAVALAVSFISELCSSLVGYSILSSLELLLVEQVVVLERLHVLVELKDKRTGCRDVILENLSLAHAGQVLDDGTQGVTMGNDDDTLAVNHLGADMIVPVGEHALHRQLKVLSTGQDGRRKVAVAAIEAGMSLVVKLERGRRNVVTAAPLKHLLFSVLLGRLSLVQTLEGAVVTLVQSPGLVMGDPKRVHLSHDGVVGLDGAGEDRGMSLIELEAVLF